MVEFNRLLLEGLEICNSVKNLLSNVRPMHLDALTRVLSPYFGTRNAP